MAPIDVEETEKAEVEKAEQSAPAPEKKRNPRAGKWRIDVYDAWCKQCGLCVNFCPKSVLTINPLESPQAAAPDECIGCMQCVLHCPDFAISVTHKDEADDGGEA